MFISCLARTVGHITALILVIGRNVREMSKEERNWDCLAKEVKLYNDTFVNGGNKCTHKTSVYGKILKYIFAEREWTFEFVGQLLGMTAQNVNYIVNRMSENSFSPIYVRRLCKNLNIDYEYVCELRDAMIAMG